MTSENLIKMQAPPEKMKRPISPTIHRWYKGESRTLIELAALPECSVTPKTLRSRIFRSRWTTVEAVTTPLVRVRKVLTPEIRASIIEDSKVMVHRKLFAKHRIDWKTLKKIQKEGKA